MTDVPSQSNNKCWCFIKVMNFLTAAMMIGFGIGGIVLVSINSVLSLQFFLFFSPIFMIIIGLIVLSMELKIKFMVEYFTFFQGLIGRGIFNIYISSTVYYYFACQDDSDTLAWIFGTLVFATGVVYFVLYCCGGRGKNQTKEQMM